MHIIGAGGHSKVVLDIIDSNNTLVTGIWDENLSIGEISGKKILGALKDFISLRSDKYIIAIGNNEIRKKIASQLPDSIVNAIHYTSSISPSSKVGIGTVIMPNASVNAFSILGKHVIINTNASVDHDCKIHDFAHISPQVGLGGGVEIGEGTHIGIGACIIQNITIGKWATIGAGTVALKNVPDYAVVVGNPGKIIKYNEK